MWLELGLGFLVALAFLWIPGYFIVRAFCVQREMIVDFWMPNKAWKGCDVNDPSARVLANYGDSGT